MVEKSKEASQTKFWKAMVKSLKVPSRQKKSVNVYILDKYTKNDETAAVAGKVLAAGEVRKKLKVAGYSFSEEAKKKIINAGGKVMSLKELLKENPKAKKVRMFG